MQANPNNKEELTMPLPIMKFFEYKHLPEALQKISKLIGELATQMDGILPDSAEKTA